MKFRQLANYGRFVRDYLRFREMLGSGKPRLPLRWRKRYPCLTDRTSSTPYDRHYVLHTAWAARILAELKPAEHVDFSSSLHFCTIVSAFVPVSFYDYRPADLQLSGLKSQRADLVDLPFADKSQPSVSCMHVIEHIGLGRYGDPLDPEGDVKAMRELQRIVAVNGSLLFVVPVGRPQIRFNAHRIYGYDQIVSVFQDLELHQYALIPDDPEDGCLVPDPGGKATAEQEYGCGCFWFRRRG